MLTGAFSADHARAASAGLAPTNTFPRRGADVGGRASARGCAGRPEQRGIVCEGLQFPDYAHAPEGAQETLAVHACLALLVGGAAMYQAIGWDTEKLDPALKMIAEENVIKDQNGKKLLQVCPTIIHIHFIFSDKLR